MLPPECRRLQAAGGRGSRRSPSFLTLTWEMPSEAPETHLRQGHSQARPSLREEKKASPFELRQGGAFPLFAIVISVVTLFNKQTSEKIQRGVKIDLHRADNCAFHLFASSNKPIPGVTFINKRHYQVPDMWLTEINYLAHGKTITSLQCCNICAN